MINIATIYRGYDIVKYDDLYNGRYAVKKDGVIVYLCASEEHALLWIDQQRRKAH